VLDAAAALVTRSCAQSGAYLKFLQTGLRQAVGGTAGPPLAAILGGRSTGRIYS